jgi:hypothetical protein
MGWHLTWQDPVALALALLGLLGALWLRRRLGKPGCGGCAAGGKAPPEAQIIPARRLSRRRGRP